VDLGRSNARDSADELRCRGVGDCAWFARHGVREPKPGRDQLSGLFRFGINRAWLQTQTTFIISEAQRRYLHRRATSRPTPHLDNSLAAAELLEAIRAA
jgi:hypothetical protein